MINRKAKLIELFKEIDLDTPAGYDNLADRILETLGLNERHERLSAVEPNPLLDSIPTQLAERFPHALWTSISQGSEIQVEAIIDGEAKKARVALPSSSRAYEHAIERLIEQLDA
jgi:hypothetical protein